MVDSVLVVFAEKFIVCYHQITDEQQRCVEYAVKGHNCMIYGEAGTGKSITVIEIIKSLQQLPKRVQIICSMGIVCDVRGKSSNSLQKETCHCEFVFRCSDS